MIYKDGWLAIDPVIDSNSGLPQGVDEHGTLRVRAERCGGPAIGRHASTLLALHAGKATRTSHRI